MASIFKIRITEDNDGYKVEAEIGSQRADDRLGNLPEDFAAQLEPLQEEILSATHVRDGAPAVEDAPEDGQQGNVNAIVRSLQNLRQGADVRRIREVGGELHEAVFHNEIYKLYDEAYEKALKDKTEMPVRLCIEAPSLSHYPWETMFDRRRQNYLTCANWTPFSRAIDMSEQDRRIGIKPPLRILIMVASPKERSLNKIDAAKEQDAIRAALKHLVDTGLIKTGTTVSGTLAALRQMIEQGDDNGVPWNVVHYIGHGAEGHLALEGSESAEAHWISAEVLHDELSGPRGPQLVVLNSCKGAMRVNGDRFSNTAEILVRGTQILASVAMQFEVSDRMAVEFSPLFYKNLLVEKKTLRNAMLLTRRDLKARGFAEWITPVLYMSGRDGPLLNDS